jgi:uncharacterized Zn finger protein (UPF0148 family)
MPTTVCPGCKDQPVAVGRYMCEACEDRMAGRPPKPPRSESPRSDQGASSASARCEKCGTTLDNGDLFCPSCGSARPSGASGRPSSARAPREDQTYQDPLFVNGVYRCPKCNAVLEAGARRCSACGVLFMNPVPQARASEGASAPRSGAARPQRGPPPPLACPHCQAPLDPKDQFCAACGSARSHAAPDPHAPPGSSAPPPASSAPSPDWNTTAPPLQRVMSSSWFGKLWRGAGALWSLGMLVLFLFSLWFLGSLIVHHFQDAGMNGVYVAEDGAGEMTFWPDGTYLMSAFGINLPGRYRIRNNGTVDMTAQGDSASNASQQGQQADPIVSMMARGLDGEVSPDRNTFHWQGHTYSYDHKPTTGPPAVPEPGAAERSPTAGGVPPSQMHTPAPQEINQSLAKPGDEFHVNTDPDPAVTDPNQIGRSPTDQNEWSQTGPKMQQYYKTHPNMVPAPTGQGAPGSATPPTNGVPNTAPPQGVIMPDENIQQELRRVTR